MGSVSRESPLRTRPASSSSPEEGTEGRLYLVRKARWFKVSGTPQEGGRAGNLIMHVQGGEREEGGGTKGQREGLTAPQRNFVEVKAYKQCSKRHPTSAQCWSGGDVCGRRREHATRRDNTGPTNIGPRRQHRLGLTKSSWSTGVWPEPRDRRGGRGGLGRRTIHGPAGRAAHHDQPRARCC